MPDTYDLNTPVGQVRLLIGDTDVSGSQLFSDDELAFFIAQANQDLYYAAYGAYGVIIRDRGKLAKRTKREGFETELQTIADLNKARETLVTDALAMQGLQTGLIAMSDDLFTNYRPTWRDNTTREYR